MNFETMTVEELEAEIAEINAVRAALKEQAVKVHGFLDARNTQASTERKLATLSDAEKALLVQMIQAQGAPSNGSVGAMAI